MRLFQTVTLAAALALLAGCAGIAPPPMERAAQSAHAASCMAWMESLDRTVEAAGVRDASAYRIPGFPYLRVDRFSSSLRAEASAGAPQFDGWVARLAALDLEARRIELANLPAPEQGDVLPGAAARVSECSAVLVGEDLADPAQRRALVERAVVPDDYRGWVRNSGLYSIAKGPFSAGVEDWHRQTAEMFGKAARGEASAANVKRYGPGAAAVPAGEIRAALARTPADAAAIETLFRAYAPQFEVETTGPYDRIGRMRWAPGGQPQVDTSTPVIYRRLAHTRFGGRTLMQLVYTAWFPERPAVNPPDILAGHLDGLVFRVTLDTDGRALAYDTIHPCGCYHMFFPTPLLRPLDAPDPKEEWAFVPDTLPVMEAGQRVAVRMASKNHYVVSVRPADGPVDERYEFAEDDALRALPLPGGGTRSLFGPDGLVAGSERPERLLFWPMGIASAGTMRQWGRQPTAFIGTRHFDDADLFEKRFARRDQR